MKKITAVNGSLSDLIAILQTVLEDYGDMDVTVCGVMPIQIYYDSEHCGIVLDDDPHLEEEE